MAAPSPRLVSVGPWQSPMIVGVGCDACRGRGYYMGGGGGALKCPYCPTLLVESAQGPGTAK